MMQKMSAIFFVPKRIGDFLFIVVISFGLSGCQAILAKVFLPEEGIREAEYGVTVEEDVGFQASDGATLVADIYHPAIAGKTPTVLVRIPFSDSFSNRLRAGVVARFWSSRGYTVEIQGSRGRYKSGGNYYPLLHERRDGIDTLKWLERQPWYDGRWAW